MGVEIPSPVVVVVAVSVDAAVEGMDIPVGVVRVVGYPVDMATKLIWTQ
jgi:hypothetical protein